jgi:uncharacterized protein (DUF305 family)
MTESRQTPAYPRVAEEIGRGRALSPPSTHGKTRVTHRAEPLVELDVDRDFVSMMIPHHQAAIEMAQAELRYGHNEILRRLAQESSLPNGRR